MKIIKIENCNECPYYNKYKLGINGVILECVENISNCPLEDYVPPIVEWIKEMFTYSKRKKWYETYWFIDIHRTVIKPDYVEHSTNMEYYEYAKECLKLMTKRKDIIMVLYTSSYPEQIKKYIDKFKSDSIVFNYINDNPDISEYLGSFGCYDKKPYFNVFLDDKAGFRADIDWKYIYEYLLNDKYIPNINWKKLK